MKNIKLLYKLIILALLSLNIFIVYNFYQYKNNNKLEVTSLSDDIEKGNNSTNDTILLNETFKIAAQSDGKKVNRNMNLKSSSGKNRLLHDLLNGKAKIVFDFQHISCKTCFDEEMVRFLDFSKLIGLDNVIFVSEYQNVREQYVLEKKYGISIYNKGNEQFGLPIEDGFYPFIFVIDKNSTAQGVYVPTTQFYSLGNIYYNIIYNKYFLSQEK